MHQINRRKARIQACLKPMSSSIKCKRGMNHGSFELRLRGSCLTCKRIMQLLGQLPLLGFLQLEAAPLQRLPGPVLTAHPGCSVGPCTLHLAICTDRLECCCCKWAHNSTLKMSDGGASFVWDGALGHRLGVPGFRPQPLAPVAEWGGRLLLGKAVSWCQVFVDVFWMTLNAMPLHTPDNGIK